MITETCWALSLKWATTQRSRAASVLIAVDFAHMGPAGGCDAIAAGMIENGMSARFADALIGSATSFNNGERCALEAPEPAEHHPTRLERWTEEIFGASRHTA
ncbi:hypothetical protein [Sphingomonas sp. Root241]|uniref:hypothetical protein n=1 Tax=Sphingomonas sp. Root241 TaxID=1736501 RepID=UPI0006FD5F42|nr:hypothetical protein [Sphingomonas sp. Root241]KRC82572.1 hypothetical protein ASE13_09965 [Sphingomonas sp. Root241]